MATKYKIPTLQSIDSKSANNKKGPKENTSIFLRRGNKIPEVDGLGEREDRAGNRTVWIGSGVGKAGEKEQKLSVGGGGGGGGEQAEHLQNEPETWDRGGGLQGVNGGSDSS